MARLIADLAVSPEALDDLWREVTAAGTPLIEPHDDDSVLATFLWRGEARSTSLWWGVDGELERLPGTDLWHGSRLLPSDLRTIYCVLHDGAEKLPTDPDGTGPTHIDPHNPRRLLFPGDPEDPTDYDQWVSVLELPGAPDEPWTASRPATPEGSILHTSVDSTALGGTRGVSVYQPAGVPTAGLPVLVVFDGYLSRTVLKIPTTLDNLIAAGRIPPLVALFVNTPGDVRDKELSATPAITDFVTHELMPWARDRWQVGADPRLNIIAGSSRGGLAAAYTALRAPEVFGAVISQSGSFWWPSPDEGAPRLLIREVAQRPRADLRFYLDVGVRETMPGPGGATSQLTVNREMRDALRTKGYAVHYAEYQGAHDYVNWRRTFADALLAVTAANQP